MKIFCKNNQFKRKKILVYGKGLTGSGAKKFLFAKGAKVFFFQDGEKLSFKPEKLDLAVLSPGISLETSLSKTLKELNVPIISELQLGFENVKGNLIAITGTNGKTTTSILLTKILGANSFYVGNTDNPLISLWNVSDENSNIVCETSSFQLESSTTFRPKISAILNLAPDHLSRHKTFENYVNQKAKIFRNQTETDFAVFNYDDKNVVNFSKNCKAKIYNFSLNNQFENQNYNGTYVSNDEIYFKENFENVFVMKTEKIKLVGSKNLENILAAICIAKLCNVSNKQIENVVSNFLPLKDRLEIVLKTQNICYVNDSKATNVASVLADLQALGGKTIALFGGSDKGENFVPLFEKLSKNVAFAVLFGATKEKLSCAANEVGFKNFEVASSLGKAIMKAKEVYKEKFNNEKINIVLAPACASFDEFRNYEERGEYFKNYILNGEKYEK